MSWRDLAREVQGAGHNRHDRHNSDDTAAAPPTVPSELVMPPLDPKRALREWHRSLSALDFDTAPAGLDLKRWRQLCEDSWWLYEGFASQLVREGWSECDCFGVLPWRPGGGALLDRLQGARNLKLDGEGRAFWSWSNSSVVMQTSRGVGDRLVSSGLVLVWGLGL